jgi:hypothetical protein
MLLVQVCLLTLLLQQYRDQSLVTPQILWELLEMRKLHSHGKHLWQQMDQPL